MDPKKVKEELGILTVELLNKHGMLKDGELAKDVELYGTTDHYAHTHQQVMMTASVNNKKASFVILSNGQEIPDEDDLQIDQIYVDRTKAALILTSLLNAFPDLIDELAVGKAKENIQESPAPEDQVTLEIDLNLNNIDQIIGLLKRKLVELESVKKRGYTKVLVSGIASKTQSHILSFIKNEKTVTSSVDPDLAIDIHLKNKEFASKLEQGKIGTVDTYNRKNKTFYISYSSESKAIKLIETNIQQTMTQGLEDLPTNKSSKYMVLDKLLAGKLYKAIATAYPNVIEKVCTSNHRDLQGNHRESTSIPR